MKRLALGLILVQLLVLVQVRSTLYSEDSSFDDQNGQTFEIAKAGRPILLPVEWNGRTYQFLLDTGAGKCIFDKTLQSGLGQPVSSSIVQSPVGIQRVELFECPKARVGRYSLDVVEAVASIDLAPIRYATGLEIYGILGADFLMGKVIDIDFDAGELSMWESCHIESSNTDGTSSSPISIIANVPQIPLELPDGKQTWIVVDTGANRTTLNYQVIDGLAKSKAISLTSSHQTASIEGMRTSGTGTLPFLKLGEERLENVRVDIDGLNLLGIEQLARFNIRLDLINNCLTMRKGNGFAKPLPNATSGMSIIQEGLEKIVVRVKQNGAAFNAGIQPGDRIAAVDNNPITTIDMFELREILTHEPGKLVNLHLNRRNQVVSVPLRLEELDVTR